MHGRQITSCKHMYAQVREPVQRSGSRSERVGGPGRPVGVYRAAVGPLAGAVGGTYAPTTSQ